MAFEESVRKTANGLRSLQKTMLAMGNAIANIIQSNIDRSQNAGEYRSEPTPSADEGGVMFALSSYTLKDRASRGVLSEAPLKDTGSLYRSIGARRVGKNVVVGPRSPTEKRKLVKQYGTVTTGITSSDLGREIPPRNPVGYTDREREDLEDMLFLSLNLDDNTSDRLEIQLGVIA